jgi:tryptophanyl-tRNA synthetase
MVKQRVFSGIRPTGRIHIGNFLGAVQNYVKLQDEYESVYCIVDVHALTTLEDTSRLQQNIMEMALDMLAAGIDPKKSILFVQSHVPEVMELFTLLGMVTPLSWLMRVPTFKEKARQQPENVNYGLVGYPVLMTADIILYKAEVVPVGEDQLPHLELAREIVRRFNDKFGPTFPEPEARLTQFPTIIGLDGKEKMSKSLGNYLEMSATPEETRKKIGDAVTDVTRIRRTDIGHPQMCNVYSLRKYFTQDVLDDVTVACSTAKIGCVECKKQLAEGINRALGPVRERRAEIAKDPAYIKDVLADGAKRAQALARPTLDEVKKKMGLA